MSDENNREIHMKQAEGTVRNYLIDATVALDEIYGPGFCKENQEFVLGYLKICVLQYQADVIADAIERQKAI